MKFLLQKHSNMLVGTLSGIFTSVLALSIVGLLIWASDVHLALLTNESSVAWGARYVIGGGLFGLFFWRVTTIKPVLISSIGAGTLLYGLGILAVPAALRLIELAGPLALLLVIPVFLASFGLPIGALLIPVISGRRFVFGAVVVGWIIGGIPWLKFLTELPPRIPNSIAYIFPGMENLATFEGLVTYVLFYPSLAPVTLPVIAGCYGAALCSSHVDLADSWTGALGELGQE